MGLTPAAFDYVREILHTDAAIRLEQGKEYLVESRLLPVARAAGHADVSAFLGGVAPDDELARQRIVEAVVTNETSWFRDPPLWAGLAARALPGLLAARSARRRLTVWSAACSSGQEPYSMAMLLADLLPGSWTVDILGTDVSEEMLRRARSGVYTQLEVSRGLPEAQLRRHFEAVEGGWQVAGGLRGRVTFRRLNLAAPPTGMPRFDVVLLRNVLIYFDTATKRQVLRRVRDCLAPDGVLVLGAAESTLGLDESWWREDVGGAAVYRRAPVATRPPAPAEPEVLGAL